MPNQSKIAERRVIEACEAAYAQKKPNLSLIAREYGVSYGVLRGRVRQGKQARTVQKPVNKALQEYQEEALTRWILELNDCHMPVTPALLEDMANLSLKRAGVDRVVGKNWVYRFIQRLPESMQLAPVKQKTKELKRIQAEDAWKLTFWYEKLKNVVKKDTPSRLIYNFDECGFQPGRGKTQKVIGGVNPPDLPEFEHSETITALECIAADGWQMDPMFIFKSATFQESWFHGSEALPSKTLIAISPNGWISDELILQWLNYFHKATNGCDRTKKGEKRVLIFDGHSAHFSAEFLQKCQDYNIICVAFEPHSTHLCQPLDGKPFLSYKQHFRVVNNELAYYAGQPAGKAEFLRAIAPVRERAFNSRIIRESFRDRGIYPVYGEAIVQKLKYQELELPELSAPDLRPYGERTPPPTQFSSSSIENSPPKSVQALEKNQKKLSKLFDADSISPKLQRGLQRVLKHNKIIAERAELSNAIIHRMTAARAPLRRKYTKRQLKPLSSSNVIELQDANHSIKDRKAKEAIQEEKRLVKQYTKMYGKPPPPRPTQESETSIEMARAAREAGDIFFFDSKPMR